ncbi:MAG: ATP-binding protein, partial [Pseudomonadota bacterium]
NDTPEIHIGYDETPSEYVLFVKDNGMGIDLKYQYQIFRPFKRLHSADQIEGTGLGLTICQKAIEKHGGRIWFERNDDQPGCIFKISFPRKATIQ